MSDPTKMQLFHWARALENTSERLKLVGEDSLSILCELLATSLREQFEDPKDEE